MWPTKARCFRCGESRETMIHVLMSLSSVQLAATNPTFRPNGRQNKISGQHTPPAASTQQFLEGTAQNPGFFVSGGHVLFPLFRCLCTGCEEPRTAHQRTVPSTSSASSCQSWFGYGSTLDTFWRCWNRCCSTCRCSPFFLCSTLACSGALRQARHSDCYTRETSSSLSDLASSFVPHARLFSLHPSLVAENSCGSHGVGAMNSCGSMHGVVMNDNSSGMHVNSWDALGHKNSCNLHAAGMQGRTTALSTSTRLGFGRPAVEMLASQQQASPKLHVEAWAGLLRNQDLHFPRKRNSCRGVLLQWPVLHVLITLLSHLGQAELFGTC